MTPLKVKKQCHGNFKVVVFVSRPEACFEAMFWVYQVIIRVGL